MESLFPKLIECMEDLILLYYSFGQRIHGTIGYFRAVDTVAMGNLGKAVVLLVFKVKHRYFCFIFCNSFMTEESALFKFSRIP